MTCTVPNITKILEAGIYVSVVNAMLVHDYGNNTLRRAKTDKKDAVKLANYGLDRWLTLPEFSPEEEIRMQLKTCYRQYQQYSKVQTMLNNNLISLLDTAVCQARSKRRIRAAADKKTSNQHQPGYRGKDFVHKELDI